MADRQRGAMTGWRGAAALLAVLALPPLPAFAAEPAPAPAYQADLMRFSELVGTIAYLDDLCGGADAGRWRGEMARLLDAQKLEGVGSEGRAGQRGQHDRTRLHAHSLRNAVVQHMKYRIENEESGAVHPGRI